MRVEAVVFDLGNTLIEQVVDHDRTLDELNLKGVEGAFVALRELHCRYRIGLLSNTQKSWNHHVRRALEKLNWSEMFDIVITSTDIGAEKPSSVAFERMLSALATPADCAVMVGNDLHADISGGRRAGMRTVFFSCNPADWMQLQEVDSKPDHIVERLFDLPALIRRIDDAGDCRKQTV